MLKTTIIEVDKKKFAIGLEWTRLLGKNKKTEIKDITESENSSFGLLRKLSSDKSVENLQLGLASDKSFVGAYSAASILSDIKDNMLIIEKVSDGKYWYCTIIDGEVLPGGDSIIDGGRVKDSYLDFIDLLDGDLEGFSVFCSKDSQSEFDISATSNASFRELVLGNKGLLKSKHKIKDLKGVSAAGILALSLIVVCSGAYYGLVAKTSSNVAPVKTVITQITSGPTQQEILASARDEEKRWLAEKFESRDAASEIKLIMKKAKVMPLLSGGWKLNYLRFNGDSPNSFSMTWKRKAGSPKTIKKSFPPKFSERLGFNVDGTSATLGRNLKNEKREIGEVLNFMSSAEYKRIDIIDAMQYGSINWEISRSGGKTRKEIIIGIKDPVTARAPQLILERYQLNMSGKSLTSITRLVSILESIETYVITGFNINFNNYKWEMKGEFYE